MGNRLIVDTGVSTQRSGRHNEYLFEGVPILQHPGIEDFFPSLVRCFDRVVELGTFNGAMALYLRRIARADAEVISYDVDPSLLMLPVDHGVDARWGNYFDEGTRGDIGRLVGRTRRRVLLLCDGGYKQEEFRMFAPCLKPGDVIMVHDYAETLEEYAEITRRIGWFDVADSCWDGIRGVVEELGLRRHPMYEELKSVLWGAFVA
jgi:hypothetical protein